MEVQEVKEQLKNIFRTVINNDKWITKYDKEGEPYHVNIDDTDDNEEKKQSDSKVDKKERLRIVYKEDKDPDGSIVGIFEDEHGEYQALTPTVSKTFKTISGAERFLASRGFEKPNKSDNSKEQEMALLDELKKLITKVENTKGEKDMEIDNEKVDKRDIIRQIMAIADKEEATEDVKTIAKLAEKLAYDKSEAGTADNEVSDTKKGKKDDEENPKNSKEVKNEDEKEVKEIKEEVKEDVENKCKNSVDNSKPDYFGRLNEIYNAATSKIDKDSEYVSRADREKAAEDYFAK